MNFRIANRADAEDVVQDICLNASLKRDQLKSADAFRPWLFSIARNRCTDHYRRSAQRPDIPTERLPDLPDAAGSYDRTASAVSDTLDAMSEADSRILRLFYFMELPQEEIARRLGIPVGTVKSRLYYAKRRFRALYPDNRKQKGEDEMTNIKKLPDMLPKYTITPSEKKPFSVRWEELIGWFIVPRLGERCSWAMYDMPDLHRTELCEIEVVGRAEVHGIEGVEIASVEYDPMECNSAGGQTRVERRFIAQLTDTHCRILAESCLEGGVKKYYTFLDGGDFLNNWGFGEDNCGKEIALAQKGDIVKNGSTVAAADKPSLLDVVGRYNVEIMGRSFDTICLMDFCTYMEEVVTEQYIDSTGRTVLWRRFNPDDWQLSKYGSHWSELLPESERLTVNGKTYVHWYDCITDHIL